MSSAPQCRVLYLALPLDSNNLWDKIAGDSKGRLTAAIESGSNLPQRRPDRSASWWVALRGAVDHLPSAFGKDGSGQCPRSRSEWPH